MNNKSVTLTKQDKTEKIKSYFIKLNTNQKKQYNYNLLTLIKQYPRNNDF